MLDVFSLFLLTHGSSAFKINALMGAYTVDGREATAKLIAVVAMIKLIAIVLTLQPAALPG